MNHGAIRWLLLVALLLVSGGAATSCRVTAPGSNNGTNELAAGPLVVFPPHAAVLPIRQAGSVFTDGFEVVRVPGDAPIEIVNVESEGGTTALRYVGAWVAGPDRQVGAEQFLPGTPPDNFSSRTVRAEGATLQPVSVTGKIGYELLLAYEVVDRQSVDVRRAIRVTYKSGTHTYQQVIQAGLVVCPAAQRTECDEAAQEIAEP